jgi:uncharacterized membrane protein YbhN (UPF0104 family)
VLLIPLSANAGESSHYEDAVVAFFAGWPAAARELSRLIYAVGALWAVGLVVVAAVVVRRFGLALGVAISGGLAWLLARLIHEAGSAPHYPLARLALVVAIVSAASPFVARPARRLGALLAWGVALSALCLGAGAPRDVLGAVLLGWGTSGLVHLAFGSPLGRPTRRQVSTALDDLGVAHGALELSQRRLPGVIFMGTDDGLGPLAVKVIGRDDGEARFLARLWRFVIYTHSSPFVSVTRLGMVEHEAYATLRAAVAGVRVPQVVAAGLGGPSVAVLVERPPIGTPLGNLPTAEATDDVLDAAWRELRLLHAAGLVHGTLDADHILVAEEGCALVDLDAAGNATRDRMALDVAGVLVATAAVVGDERAVAAAARALPADELVDALRYVQPAMLSAAARRALADNRKDLHRRLDGLRTSGADAVGDVAPPLQRMARVQASNLLMASGTLLAVGVLLSQVGSPQELWDTIKGASWGWVAAAFVISMATKVGYAIALIGAVPDKLALWPATETQVAMAFANLAVPFVGGLTLQIRFLQKQGVDTTAAVAAGGLLSNAAWFVVQIAMFCLALALTPDSANFGNINVAAVVEFLMLVIVIVGVASVVVLAVARFRRAVLPPIRRGSVVIWQGIRSPRRAMLLVVGNALGTVLAALALQACLVAFGAHLSFWTVLLAHTGVNTVASFVPIPGGGAAVGTIGITGILVAFGVPDSVAVAAVLTSQVVGTYLPAAVGWFATRDMLARGEL